MNSQFSQVVSSQYGSWRSPLTSELVSKSSTMLQHVALDGENIYWIEGRPSEGGRSVVVRRETDGRTYDVNPSPYNARTRAHEYGGGALLVDQGTIYFSNFSDGVIYRQKGSENPEPLTRGSSLRYADFILDSSRNRLISVREDHRSGKEPVNEIVAISLDGTGTETVLVSGADFYSSLRLDKAGNRLAWISWNHPNLPWTGSELWVGSMGNSGEISGSSVTRVAGLENESVFQPEWSPNGTLYFISDRTGWWNLYRWHQDEIEPLLPMDAEFGRAQWVFGMSTYGFVAEHEILCSYFSKGFGYLARFNLESRSLTKIPSSFTNFSQVRVGQNDAVMLAGGPDQAQAVVKLDLETSSFQLLRSSAPSPEASGLAEYISTPEFIEYPSSQQRTAYGWYYAPKNPNYAPLLGETPPLVVFCHGGPTSSAPNILSLKVQYWTTRGFAVLDVDYGGSTGYGTAYRNLLNQSWGIVDVEDCVSGVAYLVERKWADANRVMISGGSAGGYTVLRAVTTSQCFRAGASHYGISDLVKLTLETHKFESRYMDWLIGRYPEDEKVYLDRSPINAIDQLQVPVVFFQGEDDKVVLPNQTELMVESMKAKGLPVGYYLFPGEGHGFRKAENIQRVFDAELAFFSAGLVPLKK